MYNFITQAITRSRAVLAIMMALVLGGMLAYSSIPREADPDIPIPYIYVGVALPGISPADAERLIVKPLELELRSLTGVEEVISTGAQNYGSVLLKFDVSFDKNQALIDVREKVNATRSKLPADAEEPTVKEFNAALFPVIMVSLSGDAPERELYERARALKDELSSIPEVLEANLVGHREELLEINIDPRMLEVYNITPTQLFQAINQNNKLVPAGSMDGTSGKFAIKVPGLIEDIEDVKNITIKTDGDAVIQLADIAQIRRSFKDADRRASFNGKPTIALEVTKRIGANIIETSAAVRNITNEYTTNWPETIKVDFSSDFSTVIFDMIGGLEVSITNAIALVMILVIAALGLRSALLVGIAIPTSFLIGFFIIDLLGYTLNLMILFGLVLSVGILVDGAIVIVEYADRKMAEGLDRKKAYAMAASRMFWPVTSSTLTTLAAFAPMLFWPGVSGKFMSFLPITVIIVLAASLLTAMVFLPVLGGLIGKSEQEGSDTLAGLAAESDMDVRALPGLTGVYVRFVDWCIQRPVRVLMSAVLILYVIISLYGQFGRGIEFFIEMEPHQANIYVKARGNMSIEESERLTKRVERIVLNTPGVESAFTQASASGGGGTGVSNDDRNKPKDAIGTILVEFTHFSTRKRSSLILQDIQEQASRIPGILVEARKREDGPPTGKDVEIELAGFEFESLRAAADHVRKYLDSRTDMLRDVEDTRDLPSIEWSLYVDREAAGRFGVDVATIGNIVQFVTGGVLVGKYRPDDSDDEIDIRARFPFGARSFDQLDQLRVATPNGMIPITNFVRREPGQRVGQISRKDGYRTITLRANTRIDPETGRQIIADKAVQEFSAWLKDNPAPKGVNVNLLGANKEQKDAGEFLGRAMLASLFLMFIILLLQFNSVYHTLLTLSTVVMSTIGVLLGMLVSGQLFSVVMTGTGVVALAGIVVNNSIVLIDTFQRLNKTMNSQEAILRATGQRLRPILITTITTMVGLLPMALHANVNVMTRFVEVGAPEGYWWVQFSTAIISGLGFSTLLTLIIVPVMITLPERLPELRKKIKLRTMFRRQPSDA